MRFQSLPSVEEALQAVLGRVAPLPPRRAALAEALGLVLARDVVSGEDLPPFDNSAMDGFAVRAGDIVQASREHPVGLDVLAEAPAGSAHRWELGPGQAVRIMTGAILPGGTEAVVPVEHTTSSPGRVEILRAVRKGGNLRLAGEDVRAGEVVGRKGTRLRASEIGLLAALGCTEVDILPAPRMAVLTTGAELVEASGKPGLGQIRDANIHALCAQAREVGCPVLPFPRVPDRAEAVAEALETALGQCDVVLTNGGVSAGDYDFVNQVLERLGAVPVFRQVNQKPGRPLTFWMHGGTPVFGLPGNPVAAMVCFEHYVRPALRKILGQPLLLRPVVDGVLAEAYRKDERDRRTHFLRVAARREGGVWVASPTGPQGSGILSSMTKANAIAEIPEASASLQAGDPVRLHLTDLPEDH
jgi:molybdopterin molybdotransferase